MAQQAHAQNGHWEKRGYEVKPEGLTETHEDAWNSDRYGGHPATGGKFPWNGGTPAPSGYTVRASSGYMHSSGSYRT